MAVWYERFPGHYYLDIPDCGIRVHVCARGSNVLHPQAIIDNPDGHVLFYEGCDTLESAQDKAEKALRRLLTEIEAALNKTDAAACASGRAE